MLTFIYRPQVRALKSWRDLNPGPIIPVLYGPLLHLSQARQTLPGTRAPLHAHAQLHVTWSTCTNPHRESHPGAWSTCHSNIDDNSRLYPNKSLHRRYNWRLLLVSQIVIKFYFPYFMNIVFKIKSINNERKLSKSCRNNLFLQQLT